MLDTKELEAVWALRKKLNTQNVADVTESVIAMMMSTKSNKELVDKITKI